MINLARTAAEAEGHDAGTAPGGPTRHRSGALSPEARQALRHAIARLAIDLVSGPAGLAAILRQGLLDKPYNTPSLPLDIGYSDSIPAHIRRAVLLRDHTAPAMPAAESPRPIGLIPDIRSGDRHEG